MNGTRSFLAALVMAGLAATGNATAQSYPNRKVTVVTGAPGSTPDVLARLLAEKLRPMLGQDFIVENRPGAGGTIGAEFVARAVPDGHVLLCMTEWLFFSHLLYKKLSFDPHAFEPVSVLAKYPLILIGRGDLPFSTIAELIPYARAHPGKLNYASAGKGSMHQLVYEGIKKQAQIDLTHVPYRGGPLAMNDLLAGHVDISLTSLNQGAPHVKDGKVEAARNREPHPSVGVPSRARPRGDPARAGGRGVDGDRRAATNTEGDNREALRGDRSDLANAGCANAAFRIAARAGRRHT
jgi:tripartite-type tricarboxylate transporter receptor subunit TctC